MSQFNEDSARFNIGRSLGDGGEVGELLRTFDERSEYWIGPHNLQYPTLVWIRYLFSVRCRASVRDRSLRRE